MIFKQKRFLPYGRHNLTKKDIFNVIKVLRSSNLTQGESVPKFEHDLSTKVNAKYSVAVNSATSLHFI